MIDVSRIMRECGVDADGAVLQAIAQCNAGAFSVPHFGTVTSSGDTIYFSANTYRLNSRITLPRHCHLRGDGDASVLVWPNGDGISLEPLPNTNYANRSTISNLTLVNDAPARDPSDPWSTGRHVGVDIIGGSSQCVRDIWSIGWETHVRCSQTELVSICDVRMFGRQVDGLSRTYGIHVGTMPGYISDSTNYNWFERISFNGPYHPFVHDDGKGNVLSKFHCNAPGPMLVKGACLTLEYGSFEGGFEDEYIRVEGPGTLPFYQLCLRSLRCDAGDKHLLHINSGSCYGLQVENCHTIAETKSLVRNDGFLQGPVIFIGNEAWGNAPLWSGNDVNWDQCALSASSWYQAPDDAKYQRSGIGVGSILPNTKLQVRDP